MTQIRKFSLVYDPREDRLAWDTQDDAGVTARLWMTQKLCRGMVKALVAMLEKRDGAVPPQRQSAEQSWEQAAAMTGFGKTPGVKPQAGAVTGLIRAVHIRPGPQALGITFDYGDGDALTISVGRAAIRQTLAILYKLSVAAEWPLDIWPGWIADPAAAVPADIVN
jgi:hypothetical protein